MMKVLKAVGIVCWLGLTASCDAKSQALPKVTQASRQTMNDEQALSDIYRQINRAMLAKDTATIDRLTADGFTLTHITGYKQSKAEWLNHIATGQMQYHQIDENSVQVQINGNRADIIGRAKTKATIWGANGSWNLQLHYKAVKNGNAWQIQSAVATLF